MLTTKKVDADFLGRLAHRTNAILPMEVKEEKGDFKSVVVGTGPFMIKSFKLQQQIVTEANPNYWEKGGRRQAAAVPERSPVHQLR